MSVTIRFSRSTAHGYPEAVALAAAAPEASVTLDARGQARTHAVRYPLTADGLRAALVLWGLVESWRATRLTLGDTAILARDRYRAGLILACLTRAATFSPPARYCTSGPSTPGRPTVPCRLALLGGHGHRLEERVDWTDPARRLDQVRAVLLEEGYAACPFLDLTAFGAELDRPRPPGLHHRPGAARRPSDRPARSRASLVVVTPRTPG